MIWSQSHQNYVPVVVANNTIGNSQVQVGSMIRAHPKPWSSHLYQSRVSPRDIVENRTEVLTGEGGAVPRNERK